MTEIHQKEMTPLFFRLQIKYTMISSDLSDKHSEWDNVVSLPKQVVI